jgi:hypothetical protein
VGAPTADDYAQVGVTGISGNAATSAPNLAMVNTVLASAAVTGNEANTAWELQAIVNAYAKVLALADSGVANATGLSRNELDLLGLSASAFDTTGLALLNTVLDKQARASVDTADKIASLARTVQAIETLAATPAAGADVPHEKFTVGSMRVSVGTVRSAASKYRPVSPSPASSRRHSSGSKPGRIAGDRRGDLRRRASGDDMVEADLAGTGPAGDIGARRPPRCPNPLRTP